MPSTITYNPGDVVLVPFPFTDLSTSKQRPCFVISSSDFNLSHSDVIALAITSQIPDNFSIYEFKLPEKEQLACGLPKPSIIKLGKIVTLDQRLIKKSLGKMTADSTKKVINRFKKTFKI
jgi:mRNA interferase MazF